MKTYAPDYYKDFECKGSLCQHNCCREGWEIDIDPDTLEYYNSIDGELGEKLQKNITKSEDGSDCFNIPECGVCPFLTKEGLCELIIKKGYGALCQICDDHPRYRNYIKSHCELGVGLTCEKTVELILNKSSKSEWVLLSDDNEPLDEYDEWEDTLYDLRQNVIDIIQDRSISYDDRIHSLVDDSLFGYTIDEWRENYLNLEILDSKWESRLKLLDSNLNINDFIIDDIKLEQLLVYFVNRHVTCASDEAEFSSLLSFCILSVEIIRNICTHLPAGSDYQSELFDIVRCFSSEIEYDTENVDLILFAIDTNID